MGYRQPNRPPKGKWARWLHAKRQERDWSQVRAHEELHGGLNFSLKSRAAYAAIDMGDREPTDLEARFLVAYFGEEPPELVEEPPAITDRGALLAAITRQAEAAERQAVATERLVEALEQERAERAAWERGLLDGLARLLGREAGPSGGPGPRPLAGAER